MDMISPSIAALTPSLTLKVTNRAKAMKASGEEVYGLQAVNLKWTPRKTSSRQPSRP